MKKLLSILLVSVLSISMLASCSSEPTSSEQPADSSAPASEAANDETDSGEKQTVVIHLNGMDEEQKMMAAMDEIQTMDKFSNVEFEFHGRDADFNTKIPVSIAGGAQVDLIIAANPMLKEQYASEGLIMPLDDIIAENGYDFNAEFGPYVENAKDSAGNIVIIPHNITRWVLYYNKDLFDAAGEPYPDAEVPMTWDEYREVAARVTQGEGSDKKYGAFYLNWSMWTYGDAIMELGGGEGFYTADGLSNIEDPAFARSMERVYNMMHVDESMATHANTISAKTGPTDFMNGSYAMGISGGWIASWAMDFETYPREWKLGIAPMPVDSGDQMKSWGVVNGFGIPITSGDPSLALEVGMELVGLSAKYADTTESAIRTVDQSNLFVEAANVLGPVDDLTIDDFLYTFTNEDMVFVNEKITGSNNVPYEAVYMEEVEKYLVEEQDLATTIANIKERGDDAIQNG